MSAYCHVYKSLAQVFEEYAKYGDAMVGKWFTKGNGQKNPNVRTVFKPLLNLFHGERGSKRWKQAVDTKFKTATTVSGLLQVVQQDHDITLAL